MTEPEPIPHPSSKPVIRLPEARWAEPCVAAFGLTDEAWCREAVSFALERVVRERLEDEGQFHICLRRSFVVGLRQSRNAEVVAALKSVDKIRVKKPIRERLFGYAREVSRVRGMDAGMWRVADLIADQADGAERQRAIDVAVGLAAYFIDCQEDGARAAQNGSYASGNGTHSASDDTAAPRNCLSQRDDASVGWGGVPAQDLEHAARHGAPNQPDARDD